MFGRIALWVCVAVFALSAQQAPAPTQRQPQQRTLRPGFNLFSKQQDIQLGREAAAQIEREKVIVREAELDAYLQRLGKALAAAPEADQYPYTFKLVADRSINAFALPGGPTYVNTGLILAADNESQLVGVMAHEIAHVALRHGTNQVSKANLIQLPALIGGEILGSRGGVLGALGQLGVGLGANSLLLKFSRNAERDADLLGARMMSRAGYNPIELARFFEKLEEETRGKQPLQFLSSHPNPGNRVKAVEEEIRLLPQREYSGETGDFQKIRARLSSMKFEERLPAAAPGNAPMPNIPSTSELRPFRGRGFELSYPAGWRVQQGQDGSVTFAPEGGMVQTQAGNQIGFGVLAGFYRPQSGRVNLEPHTREWTEQLLRGNPGSRIKRETRPIEVFGDRALLTTLNAPSPYERREEVVASVTAVGRDGLFYILFIAPEGEFQRLDSMYQDVLRSVRIAR